MHVINDIIYIPSETPSVEGRRHYKLYCSSLFELLFCCFPSFMNCTGYLKGKGHGKVIFFRTGICEASGEDEFFNFVLVILCVNFLFSFHTYLSSTSPYSSLTRPSHSLPHFLMLFFLIIPLLFILLLFHPLHFRLFLLSSFSSFLSF
jgi:hypothetical protein